MFKITRRAARQWELLRDDPIMPEWILVADIECEGPGRFVARDRRTAKTYAGKTPFDAAEALRAAIQTEGNPTS